MGSKKPEMPDSFRLGNHEAEVDMLFSAFIKGIRSFRLFVDDELVYCEPDGGEVPEDRDFGGENSNDSPGRGERIIVTGRIRRPGT
jgi:hypothetical protein